MAYPEAVRIKYYIKHFLIKLKLKRQINKLTPNVTTRLFSEKIKVIRLVILHCVSAS